jgi:hypothetical protein
MKPQDVVFGIIFGLLLVKSESRWFIYAGLIAILVSIPLFAGWIFFTAERLIWYGAAFLVWACFMELRLVKR